MKRTLPWLLLFSSFTALASSEYSTPRKPVGGIAFDALPGIQLDALDLQRIEAEDAQYDFKARDGGWRFAIARDGVWTPHNSGSWTSNPEGGMTWQLRVSAANAAHLNFGFGQFHLPEGAALTISNPMVRSAWGPTRPLIMCSPASCGRRS